VRRTFAVDNRTPNHHGGVHAADLGGFQYNLSVTPQPITDAYMQEMLDKTRPFTVMILHKTAKHNEPGTDKIIWEHVRRNFALRRDGKLCVITPIADESDVSGVGILPRIRRRQGGSVMKIPA
jgi:hypothetical protein